MKKIEFAFPHQFKDQIHYQEGLTKREYFAAIALQGYISNSNFLGHDESFVDSDDLIRFSLNMADRLITELEKKDV